MHREEGGSILAAVEIAMLSTRRRDGRLVTRPMATQKRESGVDFWFVTEFESGAIDELVGDANVSLAYYNVKSWEWVPVSGTAAPSALCAAA